MCLDGPSRRGIFAILVNVFGCFVVNLHLDEHSTVHVDLCIGLRAMLTVTLIIIISYLPSQRPCTMAMLNTCDHATADDGASYGRMQYCRVCCRVGCASQLMPAPDCLARSVRPRGRGLTQIRGIRFDFSIFLLLYFTIFTVHTYFSMTKHFACCLCCKYSGICQKSTKTVGSISLRFDVHRPCTVC